MVGMKPTIFLKFLTPAQCHEEASHHETKADRKIPVADPRNREASARHVHDDEPQQADDKQSYERGSPPRRGERDAVSPRLDFQII